MVSKTGALQDAELKTFLSRSRLVVARSSFQADSGLGLLPGPSDDPAALVDTRTLCAAIVALSELADFPSARPLTTYLLALQRPSGAWEQGYDSGGKQVATPAAEDVTAMALWALMTYIRTGADEPLAERAREAVEAAVGYTRSRTLNPYLNLVETTGSLHGPAVSEGFDLWNNCAHAAAFALCHRVYGGPAFRRLALHIRRAIGLLMTFEGRFLRRLDPHGHPDGRADIALIAPHYFGLWAPTERMVMNSADLVERTLWSVELGGYIRYLPFSPAERTGLFGPSPRFAAWMAQYHYELGNKDRAEAIMRWQFDNAIGGELAEVLVPATAASRYLPELRRSLSNGPDGVSRSERERERLLEELDSPDRLAEEGGVLPSGAPSVWAHLETLRALRRGGYLERWQLGTESSRLGEGPEATA